MERTAQVLGGTDDSDDSVVIDDVTPGVGRPPPMATQRASNRTSTNVRKTWADVRHIPDDDPDGDPKFPREWLGLEHPRSHSRVYYEDIQEAQIEDVLGRGYRGKKTFRQEKFARKWINNYEQEIINLVDDSGTPPAPWIGLEHPTSHNRIYYENITEGKIGNAIDRG